MLRILSSACLVLALSSCGTAVRESRDEVKAVAERMQSGFSAVRAAEDAMAAAIEAVYARGASLDLSVDGMDAKDGGIFATFEGGKYYYKTIKSGCSYYCSPMGKVTDEIRREIRTMGYFEGALQAAWDALPPYLSIVFYGVHEPTSIGVMAPWMDVVSLFPPALPFTVFEWYRRGLASPGPGLWAALPFADLGNGWVIDLAKPIKAAGKTKGVAVISVFMMKASDYYLGKAKTPLLLLASDSTLMGASPSARTAFALAPLEDTALLKQLSANSFAPASQRLSDPSRAPEIRALATRVLAGDSGFEATIGLSRWTVESARVPEIGFYLVGLGRR